MINQRLINDYTYMYYNNSMHITFLLLGQSVNSTLMSQKPRKDIYPWGGMIEKDMCLKGFPLDAYPVFFPPKNT